MARGRLIARVGLGVVCVVTIAWLAVLLRDVRLRVHADTARGGLVGLQSSLHTTTGLRTRTGELRRSRLLDPDLTPLLNIASDLQVNGTRAALGEGRRLAAEVARDEPQSLDAWIVLGAIDRALGDLAGAQRARAQILRVDPRIH